MWGAGSVLIWDSCRVVYADMRVPFGGALILSAGSLPQDARYFRWSRPEVRKMNHVLTHLTSSASLRHRIAISCLKNL